MQVPKSCVLGDRLAKSVCGSGDTGHTVVMWLSQGGRNKSPHYVNEYLEHRTVVLVTIFSRHFKALIELKQGPE